MTIATPQLPATPIVNTASAAGKAGPLGVVVASNTAVAGVKTSKGVFTDRGVIVGRVYVDRNDNDSFEEDTDTPVVGARVYLSDGRYAVTDNLGRYSFSDLEPGQHAVRLDPITVPYRPKAVPDDRGMRGTRLVTIQGGGISTEDFPLEPENAAIAKVRSTRVTRGPVTLVKQLEPGGAGYAVSLRITVTEPVRDLTVTDPLPGDATRGEVIWATGTADPRALILGINTIRIPGRLEPGVYTLRYALFTPLPPEAVVTDPSLEYAEVIR